MTLRPYQVETIAATSAKFQAGAKRVLIVLPTGAGKTTVAAEIIRLSTAVGKRTLFLAHRRELVKQAQARFHSFGILAGAIMAGERREGYLPVQVASIQTLVNRELENPPDYVWIDEAHRSTAKSYQTLLQRYPHSRVIGLTATPFRLDGRGLADVFPEYVCVRSPTQLRDEGYLAPAAGWIYRAIDTSGVVTARDGDYVQAQLAATPNTILGDVVGEWCKRYAAAPVRTILFAAGVEHSKQFAAAFRAAGVRAEHLDGETPTPERDCAIARLRSGETHVITNCGLFGEGFDLPELVCVILARPTKSLAVYLQQCGRVLRPAPGKTRAIIHDHANCMVTHGLPYDDSREFIPTSGRKPRVALPPLTRCAVCGAVSDEHPCPECGHAEPTAARAPMLVDMTATAVSLEEIEAEQNALSDVRDLVSWKKPGMSLTGIKLRAEETTGRYGPVVRFHFQGLNHVFYTDAPADLAARLRGIGDNVRCRMIYTGLKEGSLRKLFRVFVPTQNL